ncbi:unnamed protein product [Closterium sp. NIES-64]|nr:unnamed protein product [Closterium sp. NIES-64]
MPLRKQRACGKGKEKVDDREPWEDPPYVKWMKEQCENGKTRGQIMREAAPRRDGAGPSGVRGAHADSSDGGSDTDVSDDELEEIVSSSGSEDDSDNSNAKDSSDEEESDADPAGSDAGPSTRKRTRDAKAKRKWSDEELTALAAAKWYTRDDLKQMRGKQGNQYWKKLRAHMKKSGTKWKHNSTAMQHAWKRLEAEYRDTMRHNGTSGKAPKRKKPWFEYVYLIKKLPANVKPHVLDGGGAGETHADPGAPIRDDAEMGEVNETATMAAAKVIADTITTCNAQALRQLSDTVQLLVTAIHVAATIGRAPPPQPQPMAPPPPANAHALTVTHGNEDSPALGREAGDVPHDVDEEARDDMTSD